MRLQFSLLLIMGLLTGCVDFAVNHDKNTQHKRITHSPYLSSEIYTMRGGLGGVFSKGMNHLENTLENDYGIPASSTVWFKGHELSHSIIKRYQSSTHHRPIILVGHSLGANEQIRIAHELNQAHIPVALLMTIDTVIPASIPPNVKHAFNLYKPSFVPLFSGLTVRAEDPQKTWLENINIEKINDVNVNHFTIDSHDVVQKMMLQKVLATLNRTSKEQTHQL
ncbi:MAG: hypothetical protein Q8R24_05915 [Legionellaceae bacterium]|nr:hypothetical protein [Legionellaceae bacterium]